MNGQLTAQDSHVLYGQQNQPATYANKERIGKACFLRQEFEGRFQYA
jgi:hypothetical protein